jgi:DNA processing protein
VNKELKRQCAILILQQLSKLNNQQHCQILKYLSYQPEKLFECRDRWLELIELFPKLSAIRDVISLISDHPNELCSQDHFDSIALKKITAQIDWMASEHVTLISYKDNYYPDLLAEIDTPPPYLYCLGDVNLMGKPCLAIIGSRKATITGIKATRSFTKDIAESGLIICSGLAKGVDFTAHAMCIDSNFPTIAVLGTGIDQCYPKAHQSLMRNIGAKGLLISEFPLGTLPKKHHFPQRNRIISGLSLGVLVIEAGEKSGSLITVNYALEQGRDVFAVPGAINNSEALGCNMLIKQGATMTTSSQDVIDALNYNWTYLALNKAVKVSERQLLSVIQQRILNCLEDQGSPIEDIFHVVGIQEKEIYKELSVLETKGYVVSSWGLYTRA